MSSSTSSAPDRPDAHVFELSLFGPGVGECVVVHVGDGDWIVVDSCMDPATRRAVALDYLERISVDVRSAVRAVVVTHWHDDHTRGAADILKVAPGAHLLCSAALRQDEFKAFLEASGTPFMQPSGVDALREALELVLDEKRRHMGSSRLRFVQADTTIFRSARAAVQALSPSPATMTRALAEIGRLLPNAGTLKRRAPTHLANDVAVALWVEMGQATALLGADLERGTQELTGWSAVVASTTRSPGRARAFKVPHHGSEDADDPAVWAELLHHQPLAAITPKRGGRKALPSPGDIERIRGYTDHVWCTARSTKKLKPPPSIRRLVSRMGRLYELVGPMGHVRIRIDSVTGEWNVETFGAAFHAAA